MKNTSGHYMRIIRNIIYVKSVDNLIFYKLHEICTKFNWQVRKKYTK